MTQRPASPSATLEVNLSATLANWRLLCTRHAAGKAGAVVKANAYGMGMVPVARHLAQAGCQHFFVATTEEALALRESFNQHSPLEGESQSASETPRDAVGGQLSPHGSASRGELFIYVFSGVQTTEEAAEMLNQNLAPVLNSPQQIALWQAAIRDAETPAPCGALHIDTGMCRLGVSPSEWTTMDTLPETLAECGITLIMSHLACASEPDHLLNAQQQQAFSAARAHLQGALPPTQFASLTFSLANSSGHFLSADYHFDLGRPGCSLYGITPNDFLPNPMQQVATLRAPILQIRRITETQTVGYGATATVHAGQKVAVLGYGYADGLPRIASGRLSAWLGDVEAPMLGRVSMDMTCFDVTHIPDSTLDAADSLNLLGKHQTLDSIAEICHTIGYEIGTSIGNRVQRIYTTGT